MVKESEVLPIMANKKPKPGRPRIPSASKKSVTFHPRFTPSEAKALMAAAEAEKLTVRDYIVRMCCRGHL
jgi:hypothetical protein